MKIITLTITISQYYTLYMATQDITIYTASWCAFCHQAMRYLDDRGIAYTKKDVEADPQFADEAVEKSGQRGIPVIDIAGDIIVGFDRPRIDSTLDAKQITA